MRQANGILALLLAVCLSLGLAACGGEAQPSQQPEEDPPAQTQPQESPSAVPSQAPEETPEAEGANILVAYFSATGNTKGVAERIAQLTGADLYEIVPAQPYTDADLDYTDPNSRSQVEGDDPDARPEIAGGVEEMEAYTTVFLGYPIWNGQAPRIISTFLESYDFSGKTIVPFCTSGSSPIGSSARNVEGLTTGATWLEGQRFAAGVSAEELQAWLDGLAL